MLGVSKHRVGPQAEAWVAKPRLRVPKLRLAVPKLWLGRGCPVDSPNRFARFKPPKGRALLKASSCRLRANHWSEEQEKEEEKEKQTEGQSDGVTLDCKEGLRLHVPGGAANVKRAWYGRPDSLWICGDGHGIDVTEAVVKRMKSSLSGVSAGVVVATNASLGGDPAPGLRSIWEPLFSLT